MKIGLIGTFDVNNFGDCMFPELYTKLLTARFPDADISLFSPSDRPAEILSFSKIKKLPSNVSELELLDVDYLILVGGETISVGHSSGTYNFPKKDLSAYLRLWLAPLHARHQQRLRPKFFAAHCVGAKNSPPQVNNLIALALAAADHIRFRDTFSTNWIKTESIGFEWDVDPMFLIDSLLAKDDWEKIAEAHVSKSLLKNGYIAAQLSLGYGGNDLEKWVDAIEKIHRRENLPILLLPICHFLMDAQLLVLAKEKLAERGVNCGLIEGLINVKSTAAIIGLSQGFIGSSLHGAVTAVSFGRPLAVLGHSPDGKHAGTLGSVGLTGLVAIDPADLPDAFARSKSLNLVDFRIEAHRLATMSINSLIDSMLAPHEVRNERVKASEKAVAELIRLERLSPSWLWDLKRGVLRFIRHSSLLNRVYSKARIFRILIWK